MVFILRQVFLAKGRSHDLHFLHHFQQLIFNKLPKDWWRQLITDDVIRFLTLTYST